MRFPLFLFQTALLLAGLLLLAATPVFAIGQGRFDPSFGGGDGYAEIDYPNVIGTGPAQDFGLALAVGRRGRPIVAGNTLNNGNIHLAGASRLLPSGAFDADFGYGGTPGRAVFYSNASAVQQHTFAVTEQSDGMVVYAGSHHRSGRFHAIVGRCLVPRCALGNTPYMHSEYAEITFPPAFGNAYAWALTVDAQGMIVVAGRADYLTGGCVAWVARLHPDLSLDTRYGQPPYHLAMFGYIDSCTEFRAVTIQGDAHVVAVGKLTNQNDTGKVLAVRLHWYDGAVDATFNGGAAKLFDFRTGVRDDTATSVTSDSQGRIVIGGYSQFNDSGDYDFAAARLTYQGDLDTDFNGGGIRLVYFDAGGDKQDQAYGVAVDYGNKVVLGGRVRVVDPFSNFNIGVARLLESGALDPGFGNGGTMHGGFRGIDDNFFSFGADERVTAMIRDPSGRIYVAGTTDQNRYWTPGEGENQFIVRITGEGIFTDGMGD